MCVLKPMLRLLPLRGQKTDYCSKQNKSLDNETLCDRRNDLHPLQHVAHQLNGSTPLQCYNFLAAAFFMYNCLCLM